MQHVVAGDVPVAADQLETLMASLGDQEPVERIAVVGRQGCDGQGLRDGHGEV